jgi:hypothetical protein
MIERFSTKKNVGLAALAFVLSAAVIGPPPGTQSSFVSTDANTSTFQETVSKDVGGNLTRPAGTAAPYSLDLSSPGEVIKPPTAPSSSSSAKPSSASVAVLAATLREPTPEPQETSAPTPTQVATPEPAQVQIPTQAPIAQESNRAPIVGTVSVSPVLPGNGTGEAVLQWSFIPRSTEYRIYKTGTIRPSWRLFYVYSPTVTSITIFDKPGAIAIYKIMVVVDSEETLLGEVTYRPTS